MIQFSTTPKSLHRSALALSTKTFKDNMEQQFLLLLGEKNLHHMFCAHENDQVVSLVNYYPTTIICPDFQLKVASIGSVCTNPDYRHKGLAGRLLSMAIDSMLNESTRVVIISGEGGIYAKAGSNEVGNVRAFKLSRKSVEKSGAYDYRLFSWDDFDSVQAIYAKEPIRFHRGVEEFRQLIKAQTYPDSYADYPFVLICENNIPVAYLIFQRNFGKHNLLVKEFAGNRQAILSFSSSLLENMKKSSMTFLTDPTDEIFTILPKTVRTENTTLHASLKVLNMDGLWNDLSSYVKSRLSTQEQSSIRFIKDSSGFVLDVNGISQHLNDFELNALVFGDAKKILTLNPEIAKITSKIFPIPFPWVNNLNYQ